MRGDYKAGLAIGAVVAVISAIWLSAKGTGSSGAQATVSPELSSLGPRASDTDGVNYLASSATSITTIHIVQQGETLSQISERYYDSPDQWRRIFEANRDRINTPERLRPGIRLVIPD